MAKKRWFRVVRDSDELGLDRGMRVELILNRPGGKMDVFVPSLDTVIRGVSKGHPDLEPIDR